MRSFTNISQILLEQMQYRPDSLAINYCSQKLSYGEFGLLVQRGAAYLLEHGVSVGEVVAVELADPLDHLVATLALSYIGAITVSIPVSMPDEQREDLICHTKCTRVIIGGALSAHTKYRLERITWSQANKASIAPAESPIAAAHQPWLLARGSGSTGRPKIIPITHQQQLERLEIGRKFLPYGQQDVLLCLVSMHFNSAKQRSLAAMATGAGLYLETSGKIDHHKEVSAGDVTSIYAMVAHVEALLRTLPHSEHLHYERLQSLTVTGSIVPMRLREQVCRQLSRNLYVVYGVNECSTVAMARPDEVLGHAGSVGRIVPGVRVELVDKIGTPVPKETPGRIRIATPGAVSGYQGDEEASAKAFIDGWFYPGDLGCFTPDGQLIHLGREDDMMIVGGVNVYPSEVESCLRSHPIVIDAAVLPVRHKILQDVPFGIAVIDNDKSITTDSIIEYVHKKLGKQSIYKVIIVDKIPRNDQGKFQRSDAIKIVKSHLS